MSQSTRVIINGQDVDTWNNISITYPGNNQINTCQVSGLPTNLENARFFNTEIIVYLHHTDSVPVFRGIVTEIIPSNSGMSVSASDVRFLIASSDSLPIIVNEVDNYDGWTVTQFLYDVINSKLNKNKTYIGLDGLRDSDPTISMTGFRTTNASPYEIGIQILEQVTNDSDVNFPFGYAFDIVDDGIKSNLTIKQVPNLDRTSQSAYNFSREDGLNSISYKNINPPNFAVIKGQEDIQVIYEHENRSSGTTGIDIQGDYTHRAEASYAGLLEVQKQQNWVKDVSISINKGYTIGLYSIVHLSTLNDNTLGKELNGQHVVQSKTLSITKNNINCVLGLNRPTPKVSSYLY